MDLSLSSSLVGSATLNPDKLSLNLQFATDKTLTARKGPTPTFTRASTATFIGSDGLIQSAAINAARFDHDPVTLACKGLLIEESRTNLLQRSEELDNAYWTKTATTVGGAETSPSGGSSADVITASVGAGRHIIQRSLGLTAVAHTFSIFLKKGSNRWAQVQIADNFGGSYGVIVDLDTGTITDSKLVSLTGNSVLVSALANGWYKVSVTVTATAGTWYAVVALSNAAVPSYDTNNNPSFIALGTETIFAWGAQVEAGSFATSYIPTTTASLARSADVCSITAGAFTGFWNQSEGTLLSQTQRASTNANAFIISASDGSFNNETDLRYNTVSQVAALINVSNISQLSGLQANITSGAAVKSSIAYKLNDCAYAANGASPILDTSALIPTLDRLTIGNVAVAGSNFYLNGHIASFRYFKKRLPNAKLQTLTT